MSEHPKDPRHPPEDEPRGEERGEGRARIPGLRAARRLVGEGSLPLREAKEALGAMLDSSDRVKTEAVRLVGKEVRTYLEGLGLKEDINKLLTNYSLEIKASIHLKPLKEDPPKGDEEPE